MSPNSHVEVETKLLVVDDEELHRGVLLRMLERHGWECVPAVDAAEAERCLEQENFSVVLTDMSMPGASGLELIAQIRAHHPDTATLMVTGKGDTELGKQAIEIGGYGYLTKPLHSDDVLVTVFNALRRRELEIEARMQRERLEEMVKARTAQVWEQSLHLERALNDLRLSQEETIHRLALAAEWRDKETAAHNRRMSQYCGLIARRLEGDDDRGDVTRLASVLHDIGKIGIPDGILLKPLPLSDNERKRLEQHCEIGHRILAESSSELLQLAATIALAHHERWDGSGYPAGLHATQIPLEGRIAAIADAFDALTSKRVYRKAISLPEAVETMRVGKGSQFDPQLLEVFLDCLAEVLEIREKDAE